MFRGAQLAMLLLGTLVARGAFAQLGAARSSWVRSSTQSTKKPVADVVVTATSPSLQGEQVVVTDASGHYRIPQLPPGTYTLRFEKETYRPFSRAGIERRRESTLRLNVELLPEIGGRDDICRRQASDGGRRLEHHRRTRTRPSSPSRAPGLGARTVRLAGRRRSWRCRPTSTASAISGATSPENSYMVDGLA